MNVTPTLLLLPSPTPAPLSHPPPPPLLPCSLIAEELGPGLLSGCREAVQLREQDWGNFQDPKVQVRGCAFVCAVTKRNEAPVRVARELPIGRVCVCGGGV